MSLRAIYFCIFCAHAVLTSLAVGQDPQRLELVDKISKSGDWLAELESYKLVMSQRRFYGSEELGFRRVVQKKEFGWNGNELYAYVAMAEASEGIVMSGQTSSSGREARFHRNDRNDLLSQRFLPSKSSTSGPFAFTKTKDMLYRQLQLLPVSKSMMEYRDPKDSIGSLINSIIDEDWKLRCEIDEKLGVKRNSCTLIKSTSKGFGLWTLRFIDSKSGAGLVEKISYGVSKRGRTIFESDEDIEAYLFSIETEYEEVDVLDARLPVRITGEINDMTTGNGGLRKMQSSRVVTTLDWSSFEKLSDEDLRKRTEKLMEEVEAALQ